MEHNIDRVLVMSLAHLSDATADAFERNDQATPAFLQWEYGVQVWVDDHPDTFEIYPELPALMKFAHNLACNWIRFDDDGQVYPDFPVFDEAYK